MVLWGGSAALIVPGVWTYEVSMAQLNNATTLQRCVREIEQEQRVTGGFPHSVKCIDYWGAPVAYVVRDGTYLLVSAGADGQPTWTTGRSTRRIFPRPDQRRGHSLRGTPCCALLPEVARVPLAMTRRSERTGHGHLDGRCAV